jgi:glycine/D-amino acid oxidase-like deaminating enzyme
MFNSFCEIDAGTLGNPVEKAKFLFNKSATPYWPEFLKEIEADSDTTIQAGFGTYLINNYVTDSLEDENFRAVLDALVLFNEPHEMVLPQDIPHYKPAPRCRAGHAVYIPREGWVNPVHLIQALKSFLQKSGQVTFVDGYCQSVRWCGDSVQGAVLADEQVISGDTYLLAPGAAFSKIVDASGLSLPFPRIFYGIGCSILLRTGTSTLPNCVRTPNRGGACGVYSAPQDPEHTLIGASNFISPVEEDGARAESVRALLTAAMEQINTDYYRAPLIKVNVGWRPTSEDTLPLIGKTSLKNMLVATGTKRDGLHCCPVISQFLADLILGKTSEFVPEQYQPERRPVRIYSRKEAISMAVRHTINAAYQHGFTPSHDRMVENLVDHYTKDYTALHDQVGAHEWGIPPELRDMYRYGHIS